MSCVCVFFFFFVFSPKFLRVQSTVAEPCPCCATHPLPRPGCVAVGRSGPSPTEDERLRRGDGTLNADLTDKRWPTLSGVDLSLHTRHVQKTKEEEEEKKTQPWGASWGTNQPHQQRLIRNSPRNRRMDDVVEKAPIGEFNSLRTPLTYST